MTYVSELQIVCSVYLDLGSIRDDHLARHYHFKKQTMNNAYQMSFKYGLLACTRAFYFPETTTYDNASRLPLSKHNQYATVTSQVYLWKMVSKWVRRQFMKYDFARGHNV